MACSNLGILLCRRKYTIDIVTEFGMLAAKLVSIPMEQHLKLIVDSGPAFHDPSLYL